MGQLKIQNRAIANDSILKNPAINKYYKSKIQNILKYKKFFYQYFGYSLSPTYDRTMFLESDAVVYLVIASPFDQIKPKDECFFLVGCFPYLGFFQEKSANDHIRKMNKDGYSTWKRPVYAYSTLGYFSDPILSSFFYYDDYELAELVFHELFHTIFFVKNEVELNENLASYFGQELSMIYFGYDEKQKKIVAEKNRKNDELSLVIVEQAKILQERYEKERPRNKKEAFAILRKFLKNDFYNSIDHVCQNLKISSQDCFPLRKKWNNATFAAYLTYEKRKDDITQLKKSLNLDLKGFFNYLKEKNDHYEESFFKSESFTEYIWKSP